MNYLKLTVVVLLVAGQLATSSSFTIAQTAPSKTEIAAFKGLHKASHLGNLASLRKLIEQGSNLEARDSAGRTPLHVAAFASHDEAVRLLTKAGADLNALENRAYDVVTIAAVANDLEMLDLALGLGANSGNITSPYDGTALIAAAHLGHYRIVKRLIEGAAPLDHVNNLGWTAIMESVVLGDGGPNHVKTARLLLEAGADKSIKDRQGVTPYEHAKSKGFTEMIALFEASR